MAPSWRPIEQAHCARHIQAQTALNQRDAETNDDVWAALRCQWAGRHDLLGGMTLSIATVGISEPPGRGRNDAYLGRSE
ncbi:hypothetical protein N7512_007742 [Penicillium capsulatum]|nr:hypothetical protein N7512_007742 [Penicillium capsulatum]